MGGEERIQDVGAECGVGCIIGDLLGWLRCVFPQRYVVDLTDRD